jgi:pimeloyl-ACP methyl ester carboxylesterase
MTMPNICSLRTVALLGLALLGCSEGPLPATGTLTVETFTSAIVDDEYVLRVRLPPDYDEDPGASYPLIIQLDPTYAGLEEYDITVGLVSQRAADGEWPEAIVVGVDYHDPFLRERDYVPLTPPDPEFGGDGADRFYRVLRDEILPHLEAEYRIDAEQRILVGHSKGAVFAWYTAFRHAPPEPPLFHGVVAADSGLEEYLFTYERWHAERSDSLPIRLYASRAVYNGAGQQVVFEAMLERLDGYAELELVSETLETDHGGAIVPSFEAGLAHALRQGQP